MMLIALTVLFTLLYSIAIGYVMYMVLTALEIYIQNNKEKKER